MSPDSLLCAKEVAGVLSVSERTAARLMAEGEISAMRVGRLWRTTAAKLREYQDAGFERYRRGAADVRGLQQAIVCLREVERMGRLDAAGAQELRRLESRLTMMLLPHEDVSASVA